MDWLLIGLLVLLSIAFFFHLLGAMALIGPDEPRYAQVAREMLERREFITPTIGGQPWFEKPALLYWTMMASMSLFGVNEYAARFPSAVAAFITSILLYFVGRRAASPLLGFLSAAVFIVNPMAFAFARGATMDMLLSATLTGGLCCFFWAESEALRRKKQAYVLAASACFGLAVLAKGLVGLILPAGIILAYRLATRRAIGLKDLFIGRGMLVILMIAATWYGPVIARHGWEFIQEFFIGHHFERFTSNKYRHPGPFYYYLPVILVGTFPWTPFLISSFFRFRLAEFRWEGKTESQDQPLTIESSMSRLRVFSFMWLMVPLVFFSFSGSKLPGYLLPALPGAVFLISGEILRQVVQAEARRVSRLLFGSVAVLLVFLGAAATAFARRELGPTDLHLGVPLTMTMSGVLFIGFALRQRLLTALAMLLGGCALAAMVVTTAYQPLLEKKESFWDFAVVARRDLHEDEKLVGYLDYHHSLTFYTNARSIFDRQGNVVVLRSLEELSSLLEENESVLLFMRERAFSDLGQDARLRLHLRWRDRGWVLARCSYTKSAVISRGIMPLSYPILRSN